MKPTQTILLTALLSFLGSIAFAQVRPDSLEALIKSKSGKEKIDVLLSLAEYYQNVNPQKGLQTASEALKMSEKLNYSKGKALSYANLGEMFVNLSDFNSAMENHRKALEIRKSSGDMRGVAISLNSIGGIYEHLGNYDMAMKNYYEAIKVAEENSDTKELSVSYSLVATLHYILQDYPQALEYCSRAVKIREMANDKVGMSNSYELMGLINFDFKKFDESLKYHKLALKVKTELNDKIGIAGSYQNLGMVYRQLMKYDLAENYFLRALKIREDLAEKRGIAASLTSLGEIYIVQAKYPVALDHFLRAFQIRQEIKDKRGLVRTYFHLSTAYAKMGNFKKAYENQALYYTYSDSLNKARTLKKLTTLDNQYKSAQKDKEIALLQKDSIIQKTVRNSLIAGFILVTVIALGTFTAYRSKRKTSLLLEEKNRHISSHHEELERLNDELKTSNATKDKFFSILAHDLRSPFFGFLGLSEELAQNTENLTHEEVSEFAQIINQSAKKIFNLVNNLLEWSLLQSGRINPEFQRLNIHEEVENIKELFNSAALNKSITIENVTEVSQEAFADKKMVETILRNLVSNAVKFTGVGGHVLISSKSTEEFLEISVTDSGIGMRKDAAEMLFSIDSAQSARGTRGETGSGLGLVLCKEFTEKNRGNISVESQLGKGTTFTFTLPLFRHEEVES